MNMYQPVTNNLRRRRRLRLRQQLNVPRVRRVIGRRAFASAGPKVWNSLSDNLRHSTVGPEPVSTRTKNSSVCLFA